MFVDRHMDNKCKSYRIRTAVGREDNVINVKLDQTYDTLEILSLKLQQKDNYKLYKSEYGIIVGRVLANGGVGIPNAKVSLFLPSSSDLPYEERIKYPYTHTADTDSDGIRYNLLPDFVDDECYQQVGTFPSKRKVLDNDDVIEVFENYYKYTTRTNQSGDYMLFGIPTGSQQLHVDIDLSDIGILSQRPRDMIYKGYNIEQFESANKFKQSKNLESLSQIYTQNKGVTVFPFWGDTTEDDTIAITRCDIELEYKIEPTCVFIGSAITDNSSIAINKNCSPSELLGTMDNLVASQGRIEMIRKTNSGRIEECQIKGTQLIDENGVWCYQIPMNLDYVTTDEYGNLVPTDNPEKGIPTRTSVRFRITISDVENANTPYKKCSYLVPNNPRLNDENKVFQDKKTPDYEFGTLTSDENFRDLFWNKVYTVKNFIPRIQITDNKTTRKFSGIKFITNTTNSNPFPYNSMTANVGFTYKIMCVLIKTVVYTVAMINSVISIIAVVPCLLRTILKKLYLNSWAKKIRKGIPKCIELGSDFCDDEQNKYVYYPNCKNVVSDCSWTKTQEDFNEKQKKTPIKDRYVAVNKPSISDINDDGESTLISCVENSLAKEYNVISYNFYNDWINGVLYFPQWRRKIVPKRSYLFGLFKKKAKDEWCSVNETYDNLRYTHIGTLPQVPNSKTCGNKCNNLQQSCYIKEGLIVPKQTMLDQTIYYYKPSVISDKLNRENGEVILLFATDIVLLGSLFDNDSDGTPQFFKNLPLTTFQMPNTIIEMDNDIVLSLNSNGNVITQNTSLVEATGQDWGVVNSEEECGDYKDGDGGLFYGIGCWGLEVKAKTFINLRRICELGVSLDETQYIASHQIDSTNTENDFKRLVADGFISYDEIYGHDMRSMFATMNGNNLKTELNTQTGYKQYDFTYLYPNNFDGALKKLMHERQYNCSKSYKNNYKLEFASKDYNTFRMGDNPFYYNTEENNGIKDALPRYENSYYFYFGLKPGTTAIEKFNNLFFTPCQNTNIDENPIKLEYVANNWCLDSLEYEKCANGCEKDETDGKYYCNDDSEGSKQLCDEDGEIIFTNAEGIQYKKVINKRDGYLKFDLSELSSPFNIALTLIDDESNNNDIVLENVYEKMFYIGQSTSTLLAKNIIDNEEAERRKGILEKNGFNQIVGCSMEQVDTTLCNYTLCNGLWQVVVNDADGNEYVSEINFEPQQLKCQIKTIEFGYSNDELYNLDDSKSKDYCDIADFKLNETKLNTGYYDREIGGLIIIKDIYSGNIKVEPENINIVVTSMKPIIDENNSYNKENGEFYFECNMNNNDCGFLKQEDGVYYFGVPAGDESYNVVITYNCSENNIINTEKDNNFNTSIIVSSPQPFKLYINNLDYDIIKKFKSGWDFNDVNITSQSNTTFIKDVKNVRGWNDFSLNSYETLEIDKSTNIGDKIHSFVTRLGFQSLYYYNWIDEYVFDINLYNTFRTQMGVFYPQFDVYKEPYNLIYYYLYNNDNFTDTELLKELEDNNVIRIGLDNNIYCDDYLISKNEEFIEKFREIGDNLKEIVDTLNDVNEKRIWFSNELKRNFWITSDDDIKSIELTVKTNNSPVEYKIAYIPEIEVENENVTTDTPSTDEGFVINIEKNMYDIKNISALNDITIPTLTYNDDEEFAFLGQDKNDVFTTDATIIKKYKSPYLVAVKNVRNQVVPNDSNLIQNWDDLNNLNWNVLFPIHFIDKKFKNKYKYIARVRQMPIFAKPNSKNTNIENESVSIDGVLLSEGIDNGIVVPNNKNYVEFEQQTIDNQHLLIKNINDEKSVLTKRQIIGYEEEDNITNTFLSLDDFNKADNRTNINLRVDFLYVDSPHTKCLLPKNNTVFSIVDYANEFCDDIFTEMEINLLGTNVNYDKIDSTDDVQVNSINIIKSANSIKQLKFSIKNSGNINRVYIIDNNIHTHPFFTNFENKIITQDKKFITIKEENNTYLLKGINVQSMLDTSYFDLEHYPIYTLDKNEGGELSEQKNKNYTLYDTFQMKWKSLTNNANAKSFYLLVESDEKGYAISPVYDFSKQLNFVYIRYIYQENVIGVSIVVFADENSYYIRRYGIKKFLKTITLFFDEKNETNIKDYINYIDNNSIKEYEKDNSYNATSFDETNKYITDKNNKFILYTDDNYVDILEENGYTNIIKITNSLNDGSIPQINFSIIDCTNLLHKGYFTYDEKNPEFYNVIDINI